MAPLFVAGTDTGVGKTVVSAVLLRAASRAGLPARYWKPVQTGTDSDTATVRSLALAPEARLAAPAFELPLPASPDQAATAAGVTIRLAELDDALGDLAAAPGPLLVELAGGLCVPYGDGSLQVDWLARGPHRLVLVARSGLGTLNHSLLSLEALRRRGLEPEALVLVGQPHPANRASLERCWPGLRLVELPLLDPLDPAAIDAWLDRHDLTWAWPSDATTT
ncbi:MAG: dethiobiotin synthase [Planctomycetota bacterium]